MPKRASAKPGTLNVAVDPTTKSFLIRQHYADLKEELTWKPDRVNRLCAACGVTLGELAETIRFEPGKMSRCMAQGFFPPTVELHLSMIERAVFRIRSRPLLPAALSCSTSTS